MKVWIARARIMDGVYVYRHNRNPRESTYVCAEVMERLIGKAAMPTHTRTLAELTLKVIERRSRRGK